MVDRTSSSSFSRPNKSQKKPRPPVRLRNPGTTRRPHSFQTRRCKTTGRISLCSFTPQILSRRKNSPRKARKAHRKPLPAPDARQWLISMTASAVHAAQDFTVGHDRSSGACQCASACSQNANRRRMRLNIDDWKEEIQTFQKATSLRPALQAGQ